MKNRQVKTRCDRCGACCLSSSPTLQGVDAQLVRSGRLHASALYTIRKGEVLWDNVAQTLRVTEEEVVKVREKRGERACLFYDAEGGACRNYMNRPAQCAALACWDTEAFMRVFEGPRAVRADLVRDPVLLGLMTEHEKRCGYFELEGYVARIEQEGEGAVQKILEALKFDTSLRPFVSKKLDLEPEIMDFLFGRPLLETIAMFGLKVLREPDGSFFLTTVGGDKERNP